jgi:putative flippase GtrA
MARKQLLKSLIHLFNYALISGFALVMDLISFWYFSGIGLLSVPEAATISYCTGLFFAYFIFIRSIFADAKHAKRPYFQLSLFGISGILGIIGTFLVSTLSSNLFGASRWESKIGAVFCSFFLVYWYRKQYVFPKAE